MPRIHRIGRCSQMNMDFTASIRRQVRKNTSTKRSKSGTWLPEAHRPIREPIREWTCTLHRHLRHHSHRLLHHSMATGTHHRPHSMATDSPRRHHRVSQVGASRVGASRVGASEPRLHQVCHLAGRRKRTQGPEKSTGSTWMVEPHGQNRRLTWIHWSSRSRTAWKR